MSDVKVVFYMYLYFVSAIFSDCGNMFDVKVVFYMYLHGTAQVSCATLRHHLNVEYFELLHLMCRLHPMSGCQSLSQ